MRVHFVEGYFWPDSDVLICTFAAKKNWQLLAYFGPRHGASFFLMTCPQIAEGYTCIWPDSDAWVFTLSTDFPHPGQGGGGTYLLYAKSYTRTYSTPYSQVATFWWTRIYFESTAAAAWTDTSSVMAFLRLFWEITRIVCIAYTFCNQHSRLQGARHSNLLSEKGEREKILTCAPRNIFWLYDWLCSPETPSWTVARRYILIGL